MIARAFRITAQTCTEDWRQFKKGPRIAQTLHPNFDPIQLKPKAGGRSQRNTTKKRQKNDI